jgi:hypothetical protein
MAYELTYGPIPDGMLVLHRCDNPPCCRPDHLFLGTNADNSADKVQKKRHPFGVAASHHKLTEDAVRAIRSAAAAGVPRRILSARFNVARPTVHLIIHRRAWKHVE